MESNTPQPKLSETILKRIEAGEAPSPRPRSYFIVRSVALWSAAILSLLFGALAVATIIFRLNNFPRLLPPPEETSLLMDFVLLLPYLWLMVLGCFSYIAYREFRSTRQGYKYELSTVILSMVVVSGLFGAVLYVAGTGYVLDRAAGYFLPFGADIESIQRERWLRPEHGLLVGEVIAETGDGFMLRDLEGEVWEVFVGHTLPELPPEILDRAARIGVRGVVVEEGMRKFVACHYRVLALHGRGVFEPKRPERGPFASSTSPGERKPEDMRITKCEGVRPLQMNS